MDMVEDQIAARGVRDRQVLDAMRAVPRHRFVPANLVPHAYEDRALPIGYGVTISQPYIVAYMTEALALAPDHRVLEIGTGSAYQTAILAEIAREVFTIEIIPQLAGLARETLTALGYANVHIREGDGHAGWAEQAPFDRIIVTAAPSDIPEPLVDQLAIGGRMVIPVGDAMQWIVVVDRTASGVTQRQTIPVAFVPFVRGQ
jgi:protein-L-isoaspartate(D-aspartate) O-methyltransferase